MGERGGGGDSRKGEGRVGCEARAGGGDGESCETYDGEREVEGWLIGLDLSWKQEGVIILFLSFFS